MAKQRRPWPVDRYPEGCRGCGSTTNKLEARQLCTSCYPRRAAILPDEFGTVSSFTSARVTVTDEAKVGEVVPPIIADFNPFEADLADQFPSGEARPGSSSSPSPGLPLDEPAASPPGTSSNPLTRLLGKKKAKPEPDAVLAPPPVTKEKRPSSGPAKKRSSIANDIEQLIGSLGARFARVGENNQPLGKHYALGQYLQWNAPATAEVIDENVRDTFIDKKFLQPLAAGKDKVGAVGGVVAPPLLIFAIEANPNLLGTLYPALYMAIEASLDSLLPAKKRAEARAKKRADAIRESFGPDLPAGVDPVASMIESLFPWAFVEQPIPQPAPTGDEYANAQ